jgi:hypothetical protein
MLSHNIRSYHNSFSNAKFAIMDNLPLTDRPASSSTTANSYELHLFVDN